MLKQLGPILNGVRMNRVSAQASRTPDGGDEIVGGAAV
jgi:hypothetical protein